MKQLRYLFALLALLAGPQWASAQVFEWASLARGSRAPLVGVTGSATTPAGDTYSAITFRDTLRVGTSTLVARAGDGAVVKYDSTGQVTWVRQLRGIYLQNGIAADPVSGGIYLLGQAQAGATWGGTPFTVSTAGSFYAKCSAAGAIEWVNALPLVYGAYRNLSTLGLGGALAADGLGNCYVMGNVRQRATLGGVVLDSTTTFLLRASSTGTIQWVRTFKTNDGIALPGPGTGPARFHLENVEVVGKPGGGCLVLGYFNGYLFYSSAGTAPVYVSNYSSTSNQRAVLVSLDGTGNFEWAQIPPLLGNAPGFIFGIGTDAAGNVYGTGRFGNLGFGLVKYNAAGVQQWFATSNPPALQPNPGSGAAVVADAAGNVTVAVSNNFYYNSAASAPLSIGTLVLRSYTTLVRFTAQGQARWAVGDVPPSTATSAAPAYLEPGGLGLDARGNVYYTANVVQRDSAAGPRAIILGSHTLMGRGVVTSRIGQRYNTITGALYLDQNGNGQRDASDPTFPRTLILQALPAVGAPLSSLDTDGQYRLYVGPGAYNVTTPVTPRYYVLSQPASGTYTGSFSGYGAVDSARHFGFRPIANRPDVQVVLTPYGAARPGFTTRYRLTVSNEGTTTIASGTATLTLDSRSTYVSSTPTASRSGQTLTWTYTNLAPFERREFDVLFSLPVTMTVGAELTTTAAAPLAGDVEPADNTTNTPQIVTGPFDPNDITVNYSRLSPTQVAAGLPLDYTIRFQNIGSDTAFSVVISDTLNFRMLNLTTMQLVAQSHNCMWSLSNQGLLTVRFLNAKLPARSTDVLRSQGFVRFRVQPRTTLAVGDIIPNRAHIFFDYNAPVGTNTATTAVLNPTAVLNSRAQLAWATYPNPATEALNIEAELPTAGLVHLQLLDLLGRGVQQLQLPAPAGAFRQTLSLGTQAPGLYVLRLTLPDGRSYTRQVERK